jgi:fumarate reductase flavoprotein subunit
MDAYQGYGALADPYGIIVNYETVMHGGITVNTEGKRFSNEVKDISGQALNVLAQPGGIGWIIFDDKRRALVEELPEFRELLSLGGVKTAVDVDELAETIKVPVDELKVTFSKVAAMQRGAVSCPWGRDFTKVAALSKGPFYAIKTTGALFHTQGGLKIDEDARVLRKNGTTLPNLFASGGTACSISGNGVDGYLPAAGLCMAVTLGMLAGNKAAQIAQA